MYRCENLTTEKAESQRTDAFELWCWRRLWRAPWTARSNQSILKEINPEYSLEGLMLKLKRQYFGYLMWIADLLEKTLMLGKIEGKRRRGMTKAEVVRWHHWLNGHEFKQTLRDSGGRWNLVCCCPWDRKSWTCLGSWTDRLKVVLPGNSTLPLQGVWQDHRQLSQELWSHRHLWGQMGDHHM